MSTVHAVVLIQCEIDVIPEAAAGDRRVARRERGVFGRG